MCIYLSDECCALILAHLEQTIWMLAENGFKKTKPVYDNVLMYLTKEDVSL